LPEGVAIATIWMPTLAAKIDFNLSKFGLKPFTVLEPWKHGATKPIGINGTNDFS
jgi:hypothetical protein